MADVAFVIPTLDEAAHLPGLLEDLAACELDHQIIVADGGSRDGTVSIARAAGAVLVEAAGGRGPQLNAGAQRAAAEWLCFFHADVRVPGSALSALQQHLRSGRQDAAVWRLRIGSPRTVYRMIEWGARLRTALVGLPYGDQGLLVRRERFMSMGGYPAEAVMEDVALIQKLDARITVARFSSGVTVSPRRWERAGVWRQTARNTLLLAAYLAGASPRRLARWYQPEPGG